MFVDKMYHAAGRRRGVMCTLIWCVVWQRNCQYSR